MTIVNRNIGDEIELNYLKSPYKVGSILLAKKTRADIQGLRPYLKRLKTKINKGCNSLYIIAFPNSYAFFERLINAIDSEQRINIEKIINTIDFTTTQSSKVTNYKIAVLSSNNVYGPSTFRDKVEASSLKEGEIYTGTVEDLSKNEAIVNLMGVRSYIKKDESSWFYTDSCKDNLETGEDYRFKIIEIDFESGVMYLSRKINEENPWHLVDKPGKESKIEAHIVKCEQNTLYGQYNSLKVVIPISEISWYSPISKEEIDKMVNERIKIEVLDIKEDSQEIVGSIKALIESPWEKIHGNLPKGKEFLGKVVEINKHFVRIDIGNSVIGILPKESLEKAGYEYENYEENLKKGQGLEVYISKVFVNKQKIRLDLTRNKNT